MSVAQISDPQYCLDRVRFQRLAVRKPHLFTSITVLIAAISLHQHARSHCRHQKGWSEVSTGGQSLESYAAFIYSLSTAIPDSLAATRLQDLRIPAAPRASDALPPTLGPTSSGPLSCAGKPGCRALATVCGSLLSRCTCTPAVSKIFSSVLCPPVPRWLLLSTVGAIEALC